MTLKELRNGDIVVLRNKGIYMYIEDKYSTFEPHDLISLEGGFMSTNSYDDNFKGVGCSSIDWDIVKVYRPYFISRILEDIRGVTREEDIPIEDYCLVYRDEITKEKTKEMTIAEISKALGYEVKIVKEDK